MHKIDTIDEILMRMVNDHNSLQEMADITGRSKGGVKLRLNILVEMGLVQPPPRRGMSRSYKLTNTGLGYMTTAGYI